MKAKAKFLLIIPAALLLAFAPQQNAPFTGRVVNGSFQDKPVKGVTVVLQGYRQGQDDAQLVFETKTDDRGFFRFDGLKTGDDLAYYPQVTYGNVRYTGALLPAGSDSLALVRIFEATESDSAILTSMNHVLFKPGTGLVQVREVYQLGNRGLFTFVGSTVPGKTGVSLVFPLPERAGAVSVGGELMSCCTIIKDGKVSDTMEFKPGIKQAVVNYELPSDGDQVVFSRQVMLDTELMDFYLPGSLSIVQVKILEPGGHEREITPEMEPFDIRGTRYQRFVLDQVDEGSVVTMVLAGVPGAPADLRIFGAGAVLLLLAIAFYAFRRLRPAPVAAVPAAASDAGSLQERRTQLIQHLLHLEDRFENGELPKEKYMLYREQMLQQVEEIDRLLGN